MKIVIITGQWYGGGAESVSRDLFSYLNKEGDECYYLYASGDSPKSPKIIKCGYEYEHYLHALKARFFDTDGIGSPRTTNRLIKQVEEICPDIINIHNIVCYSYDLKILLNYLRRTSIPVVWTLHDCWTFTGHCISIDEENCLKWKTGCGNCPAKGNFPKSLMLDKSRYNYKLKKQLFLNTKKIVFVTPSLWLKKIINQTFLQEFPIHVINNGIDLTIFKPTDNNVKERFNISKEKIVILFVASRWTKSKGINFIIELSQKMDLETYRLVVIGNINKYKQKLSKSILHIERTNDRYELAAWYTVADIFVNPTLADNYPTVNLESLACGTPVVTFNTGGSWESIGDKFGCLAVEKTSNALQLAIQQCLVKNIKSYDCTLQAKSFSKDLRYAQYRMLFKDSLKTGE